MNLMPFIELVENAGLGQQGKTLFLNMMPSDAEQAILLRSLLTGTEINYELPGFYKTKFQLIVRDRSYASGEERIAAVVEALTIATETEIVPLTINYCRPRTEPVAFPLSDGNLLEFSVQFDICFVKGA